MKAAIPSSHDKNERELSEASVNETFTLDNVRRDFKQIEKEFFDIDEETGTAKVCLHFVSPHELLDGNCMSKTALFNDDFEEWLQSAFAMIPSKYRIALEITFDDMAGYTPDQLTDIFRKNLMLSARSLFQSIRSRDRIALGLIAAGVLSFIAMMLFGRLWEAGSFWHEVFFYFLDIATTVMFWEAAGILLVENREHRATMKAFRERFDSIRFSEI